MGEINWDKYARSEYKVENRFRFPTRRNVLSEIHKEFSELRFVFDICKAELLSSNTPARIRTLFKARLTFVENKLYRIKPRATELITTRSSDSPVVLQCKEQGNIILQRNLTKGTAWRVDFNEVFERFVQYVFAQVARAVGGKLHANVKFLAKSSRPFAWEQMYLEPDAIFTKEDLTIFIDAKYKSHLYNKFESSELLKDDFRRDLHQILSYSSFAEVASKFAVVCYPSNEIESKMTRFRNAINDVSNSVLIVGIPLRRISVPESIRHIKDRFDSFERTVLSL
jgi:hypothetical protein